MEGGAGFSGLDEMPAITLLSTLFADAVYLKRVPCCNEVMLATNLSL